ncbi:hypothetical protein D1816_17380 [Aquimarina sp. AD10]|uniref:contractile injection system tape measure protein n=1 Tax=Aquimarina sp. AD10 TaxID=1714849 RepID=UPI000E4C3A3C|nr:contractile injection system tape measure protein [Aquimarina sp. AD10]AXT62053.1 hypothetical protein D1816_17380 [Aquimarina sp. AD10]RKM99959.1 hypothetical protein D7033_10200 [Aquimarina sp. AD10]
MIKSNHDIVDTSTFSLKYESKTSASRGNILIESIFNTHILPHLEEAISNTIPEEALLELSKLEIDIGQINESEFTTNLGERIKIALETALHDKLSAKKNSHSLQTIYRNSGSDAYLIEAIEIYLTHGYLPSWVNGSIAIQDLVIKIMQQAKDDFKTMLITIGKYDTISKRIAFNLPIQLFDEIFLMLHTTNTSWIFEVRKILMHIKKTSNFNKTNDEHFLRTVNFFIIHYVLTQTSAVFSEGQFLDSMLKKVIQEFKLEPQLLLKAVKSYSGNQTILILVHKVLEKFISNISEIDIYKSSEKENIQILETNANSLLKKKKLKVDESLDINSTTDSQVLEAIIEYLTRGHFPFWINKSITIENLISRTLEQSKDAFIKTLLANGENKNVSNRIASSLTPELFDKILLVLNTTNNEWILEVRAILIHAKKNTNLNTVSDNDFLREINIFILHDLLTKTNNTFNKAELLEDIIQRLMIKFSIKPERLLESIKSSTKNTTTLTLFNKAIEKNQELILKTKVDTNFEKEDLKNLHTTTKKLPTDHKKNKIYEVSKNLDNSDNDLKPDTYLITAIIAYFKKGYFPFWVDSSVTINDLVSKALKQSKNAFIKTLVTNGKNENISNRITSSLIPELFDQLIQAQDAINNVWIFEVRAILIHTKTANRFHQFSDHDFLQKINFFILQYLLNTTSVSFNKSNFLDTILNNVLRVFNLQPQPLIKSINTYTGNVTTTALVKQRLENFKNITSNIDPVLFTEKKAFKTRETKTSLVSQQNNETKKKVLVSDTADKDSKPDSYLINAIAQYFDKGYLPFWVDSSITIEELVLKALDQSRDTFRKMLLIHSKNEQVTKRIVASLSPQLFDQVLQVQDANNSTWILEVKKILMHIKNAGGFNEFNTHDVLQKINFYILNYLFTKTSEVFTKKHFLDVIIHKVLKDFNATPQLLLNSIKTYTENETTVNLIVDALTTSQYKDVSELISHKKKQLTVNELITLLNSGNIDFKKTTRRLLKKQIKEVLEHKEKRDVLFDNLTKNGIQQILKLYYQHTADELIRLLISFTNHLILQDKNEVLQKPTLAIKKLIISTILYYNENTIRVFDKEEYIIFLMYASGVKNHKISANLKKFVTAQGQIDLHKIKRLIAEEKQFAEISHIQNLLSKKENESLQFESKSKNKVAFTEGYLTIYRHKIIGHYLISGQLPETFYDLRLKDVQKLLNEVLERKDQFLVVLLERNNISEMLIKRVQIVTEHTSTDIFEEYLIYFFKKEYFILSQLFGYSPPTVSYKKNTTDIELEKSPEYLNKSNTTNFRTLLAFIIGNQILFKKVVSITKDYQIPKAFAFWTKQTRPYLNHLISFSPGKVSNIIDETFWKSIVLRFGISIFIEEKEHTLQTFIEAFMNYLRQSLTDVNKEYAFDDIIEEIKVSKLGDVKNTVIQWSNEVHKKETKTSGHFTTDMHIVSNDTLATKNSSQEVQYYISILKFYANNRFFPWWSNTSVISELFIQIKKRKKLFPKEFKEAFFQLEKEKYTLDKLAHQLPIALINEFDQLIPNDTSLKTLWKKSLKKKEEKTSLNLVPNSILKPDAPISIAQLIQKDYKDTHLLSKHLYSLDDNEILTVWSKEKLKITDQVREYIALSSYFYFRNINPTRWRRIVYEFSFEYYNNDTKEITEQFHHDFLKYVKSKHQQVDWGDTLTTVYKLVQSSKNKDQLTFPKGLVKLFQTETSEPEIDNYRNNLENNLIPEEETGIEVQIYNAGLIILWPFLTRLFEHFTLVKNRAFVDLDSMHKAVYMLQYLAYATIDFPEHQLVLNKILVGMPSQEHLPPFTILSQEEKDMAYSLLYGVINNWEKVKNSSPEGIQETFLQREGVLKFEEEQITLKVEKKGVDVLLSSISWNISLVKLPWMKKPLFVEWI